MVGELILGYGLPTPWAEVPIIINQLQQTETNLLVPWALGPSVFLLPVCLPYVRQQKLLGWAGALSCLVD